MLLIPFLYYAVLSLVFLATSYVVSSEAARYFARHRSFAGPPGLPILGNLRDVRFDIAEVLRKWSWQYGSIFQIQLGDKPVLVVNSAASAKELFNQHGNALNSRPTFYTFHQIVARTGGATIGTSPMSPELKMRRRAAASALNKPAVASYAPHLHLETKILIVDIFRASGESMTSVNPVPLIRRFALSVVLTINWGTRVAKDTSEGRALFDEVTEVEDGIVSIRHTVENFQDYVPLLRLNPFSSHSAQAQDWRERRDVYLNRFDAELRRKLAAGTHAPCIQANAMLDNKLAPQDLKIISTSMVQGGTGTIASTLAWSLAYLSLHPEVQQKAYKEISSRLPTSSSILSAEAVTMSGALSYLHALGQECLRYFTVLRLSLPRQTTQPITLQDGRYIRADSTIFLNAWACNMDRELWSNPKFPPEQFHPERWFEQPGAPLFTYGLGYRMCAGSALANRELEVVLLRVIGCYEMLSVASKEADANPWTGSGNMKEPGGFPKKYEIVFRPRDMNALRAALDLQNL